MVKAMLPAVMIPAEAQKWGFFPSKQCYLLSVLKSLGKGKGQHFDMHCTNTMKNLAVSA